MYDQNAAVGFEPELNPFGVAHAAAKEGISTPGIVHSSVPRLNIHSRIFIRFSSFFDRFDKGCASLKGRSPPCPCSASGFPLGSSENNRLNGLLEVDPTSRVPLRRARLGLRRTSLAPLRSCPRLTLPTLACSLRRNQKTFRPKKTLPVGAKVGIGRLTGPRPGG